MGNVLLERLRNGEVLLGLSNMYPASGIVECMCAGWDFVWIDCQHGQLSYDSTLHAVQAARATRTDSLIRVAGHDFGLLGPYADLAPAGIVIPMVNNAEQAQDIVSRLRFPPLGSRSYGGRRVIDLYGRTYYQTRHLLVATQIETIEAVENAEKIISTPGVDMLFFGPEDMKVQMGIPVEVAILENATLRGAMAQTAKAARSAGKLCGCVALDSCSMQVVVNMGYQLIIGGGDFVFLRTLAAQRLAELRAVLPTAPKRVVERRVSNGRQARQRAAKHRQA